MAKPSTRRPWVVEMQPLAATSWYHMDAYHTEAEARMQAELMQQRAPKAKVRFRHYQDGLVAP